MANLLRLYFNTTLKQLVFSETDYTSLLLPEVMQEDILSIEFMALKHISQTYPFFERINLAGMTLIISIGIAGTVHASQNVWAPNADNTILTGSINLKTAGIDALADGATLIFEILLSDFRGHFPVTYRKSVRLAASIVSVPGEIALTKTEAKRLYVEKEGAAGAGILLTSADGTKKGILYWDNDGSLRSEPIT
jgi:hypothetical protein